MANCETMDMNQAVDKAIQEMPEEYEIKEFLVEHQSEVKNMCITEYNEIETMEIFKEEARKEGREAGREEGREEGRMERDFQKIEEMLRRGKTVEEIVDFCQYPYEQVKEIADSLLASN